MMLAFLALLGAPYIYDISSLRVNDVRQGAIHPTEPVLSEPRAFEVEMGIDKLRGHKSPGTDPIPAEMINPLKPNDIYMSYRSANLQTLHFKYLFNKYTY